MIVKDGTYPAKASGSISTFQVDQEIIIAQFNDAVKGVNVLDEIYVKNGAITSNVLGYNGVIVERSRIEKEISPFKKIVTTEYSFTAQQLIQLVCDHLKITNKVDAEFKIVSVTADHALSIFHKQEE